MGDRVIREADTDRTPSNILGAACDFVNRTELDDTQKFHVGVAMGKPTDILPDGSRIQALQSQRKGKRHYSGGLDKVQRPPQKRSVSRKPQSSGVSPKRIKKKLLSSVRKGTPNTQKSAEELLEDMANGVVCSGTDYIADAADDTDDDDEPSSQEVANMAIDLKKIERERKGK